MWSLVLMHGELGAIEQYRLSCTCRDARDAVRAVVPVGLDLGIAYCGGFEDAMIRAIERRDARSCSAVASRALALSRADDHPPLCQRHLHLLIDAVALGLGPVVDFMERKYAYDVGQPYVKSLVSIRM